MSQFSFQYPFWFLLIILFFVCTKWCPERSRAIFFPHINRLLKQGNISTSWLNFIKWIGIILAVIALASPVLTKSYTNSKKEGRDIVLILDSSQSMQQPFDTSYRSRFEVLKSVIVDFIKKRKNDRIGMITFADIAFIASPLTFEKKFLKEITKMQKMGAAGQRTAINDAIVQSYALLEKSKAKSKIAILLTDGIDNMSKVVFKDVENLIEERDIKLYAIGVGRAGRDYNGAYLQALSDAGKGKAYGASDASELEKIYEEIDRLEATKINNKKVAHHAYLYIYPLSLALLFLFLFLFIKQRRGV